MSRDKDAKINDLLAACQGERTARAAALRLNEELEARLKEADAEIGRLTMELKRLQENEHG